MIETACRIDIMDSMLCHVACSCWTSRMFLRGYVVFNVGLLDIARLAGALLYK